MIKLNVNVAKRLFLKHVAIRTKVHCKLPLRMEVTPNLEIKVHQPEKTVFLTGRIQNFVSKIIKISVLETNVALCNVLMLHGNIALIKVDFA